MLGKCNFANSAIPTGQCGATSKSESTKLSPKPHRSPCLIILSWSKRLSARCPIDYPIHNVPKSAYLNDRCAALGICHNPDVCWPHFEVVDLLCNVEEPFGHVDAARGREHHVALDPGVVGEILSPANPSRLSSAHFLVSTNYPEVEICSDHFCFGFQSS